MISMEFSLQPEEKKIWKVLELDYSRSSEGGQWQMLSMGPDSSPRAPERVKQAVLVADGGGIGLSLSRSGWVCCFAMAHLSPGVSNWGPACCFQSQNYRPMETM